MLSGCVSASQYESEMKKKNQEIERLSRENQSLVQEKQTLADQAKAQMQARSADIENTRGQFKALSDAGSLKLKLVDGRVVVVLPSDVLFSTGSADLSEKGRKALTDLAKICASMQDKRFQVEGHTDNVPITQVPGFPYGDNWELGSARALSVVNLFIGEGVNPERISAASFGETRPVQSNDTEQGRAQNRRIEIVLIPDLSKVPGFEYLNETPPQ